jgi:hypothetical protein
MVHRIRMTDGGGPRDHFADDRAHVGVYDGVKLVSHEGANVGWAGIWQAVPSQNTGFILLTNGDISTADTLLTELGCTWLREVASMVPPAC